MKYEYMIKEVHRKSGDVTFSPHLRVKGGLWEPICAKNFNTFVEAAKYIDAYEGCKIVKTVETPYP